MINIIWQTENVNKPVLNDETMGQFEYIDKVIFKNVEHTHYFDNKSYKTLLKNTVIIYSAPDVDIDIKLKEYLRLYKAAGIKYMLFHLSNESLGHNYEYYADAVHVFRFHYDHRIKSTSVTTLPLGFTSGYMNEEGKVNLSDKRDISMAFIGQSKADRHEVIDIVSQTEGSYVHLINTWGCSTSLSFNDVIDVYKRTKFIPCPMGNTSPETLRLFESLEWGCVPIIKKYTGVDYYKCIFGEHPFLLVNEWFEINNLIKKLDNEELDKLILQTNAWYRNFMDFTSKKVEKICSKII